MKIRKARLADVPELVPMGMELLELHKKFDPVFYRTVARARWKELSTNYARNTVRARKSFILVAEEGGKLIGFLRAEYASRPPVMLERKELFVTDLFVSRKFRGKGVGTALLNETQRIAKEKNVQWLKLEADVKNGEARKFYSFSGFYERSFKLSKRL